MYLQEVNVEVSIATVGKIPVARDSLGPVQEGTTMGQIPQNVSNKDFLIRWPSRAREVMKRPDIGLVHFLNMYTPVGKWNRILMLAGLFKMPVACGARCYRSLRQAKVKLAPEATLVSLLLPTEVDSPAFTLNS